MRFGFRFCRSGTAGTWLIVPPLRGDVHGVFRVGPVGARWSEGGSSGWPADAGEEPLPVAFPGPLFGQMQCQLSGRVGDPCTDGDEFAPDRRGAVSYTHLRAHETGRNLVCRLLL